ncbi:TnsA-like heteromeric transposase endonuclease subunit [Streptomyces sp. NPDC008079]|uniref:TnsA-like heteromeric transposase endonuclease subunit n=1 Tax=Streptomyces sp. NPDC008079 TaxID=3364806 RepID=UPI0036EFA80F
MDSTTVSVSLRRRSGEAIEDREWATATLGLFESAAPWRTFRWYKGQRHYSGTYWSATTNDHVIYESRLELTRLLFADFDPLVQNIKAQPFLLKSSVNGKIRKHIPDYLLITKQGSVVVDVKPRRRLSHSDVAFTFEWTRQAVESRGWQYEVWSEPPEAALENVRFLAGYRRKWLFSPELLDELRSSDLNGVALGEAVHLLPDWPALHVRAALHHLLWTGDLVADLGQPLSSHLVLRRAA